MDKEDKITVIEFLFEIANQGNHAEDAIELLPRELENDFSSDEIDAIIQLAEIGNNMNNKCKFAIFMYQELLRSRIHKTPFHEKIKEMIMRNLLLRKHHTPDMY